MKACELEYVQLTSDFTEAVQDNIRKTYANYQEAGTVLVASERRLPHLLDIYKQEGRRYFVALSTDNQVVAGCGIGTLQGLPSSEGIAEVRDLFVAEGYRGCGIGGELLIRCLRFAYESEYKHVYLQTTPEMESAQRLFRRFGFQPVEDKNAATAMISGEQKSKEMPCYFILNDLASLEKNYENYLSA